MISKTINTSFILMRWYKLPGWWTSVEGFSHSRRKTLLSPFIDLLPSSGFAAIELQRCIVQTIYFPVLQQTTVYYYQTSDNLSSNNHVCLNKALHLHLLHLATLLSKATFNKYICRKKWNNIIYHILLQSWYLLKKVYTSLVLL